jgi:hypothetical protein
MTDGAGVLQPATRHRTRAAPSRGRIARRGIESNTDAGRREFSRRVARASTVRRLDLHDRRDAFLAGGAEPGREGDIDRTRAHVQTRVDRTRRRRRAPRGPAQLQVGGRGEAERRGIGARSGRDHRTGGIDEVDGGVGRQGTGSALRESDVQEDIGRPGRRPRVALGQRELARRTWRARASGFPGWSRGAWRHRWRAGWGGGAPGDHDRREEDQRGLADGPPRRRSRRLSESHSVPFPDVTRAP